LSCKRGLVGKLERKEDYILEVSAKRKEMLVE
jgi:hypothetical protein